MKLERESYFTLIQSIPDIIYRIDKEGNYTFISKSIEKLGYSQNELIGKHFATILHPDDVEQFTSTKVLPRYSGKETGTNKAPCLFDERRTGERISKNFNVRLVPKNGTVTKYPLGKVISIGVHSKDDNAHYLGTVGIIRDISETLKAEKAYLMAEQHYRLLIDNSMVLFTILTPDGTILYKSNSIKPMMGYESFDLIGEKEEDYIHEKDRQAFNQIINSSLNSCDTEHHIEISYRKIDKQLSICDTRIISICDDTNEIMCYVLYSYDITERKHAEEKLKVSIREKELLLQEIHHRVKNNMQIISGLLNLQKSHVKDETDAELFTELINRIRAMAQVHQTLYQSGDFSHINFMNYIKDIAENIHNTYCMDNTSVEFHYDFGEGYLNINKAVPCGLIVNELLSNVYKHAFAGLPQGDVYITFKKIENDMLLLQIRDNGRGLPDEIDFYRTDSMGLQLINSLALQLRGKVKCAVNNGTDIRIEFPSD